MRDREGVRERQRERKRDVKTVRKRKRNTDCVFSFCIFFSSLILFENFKSFIKKIKYICLENKICGKENTKQTKNAHTE